MLQSDRNAVQSEFPLVTLTNYAKSISTPGRTVMLQADQARTFRAFYDSARAAGLDVKTTTLVGLAAALTAGCFP